MTTNSSLTAALDLNIVERTSIHDAMIIPPTWSLPEAIRVRLGQTTYGRQRAMFEEGHLLLVLHKPPGPDE